MFSDIRNKAKKEQEAQAKADQKRLEAFLAAIQKLEAEHHCEIQAEVKVTRSAIVAIPNAVVHPIPEPTNAPTNPPTGSGTPPAEAGQVEEATPQA